MCIVIEKTTIINEIRLLACEISDRASIVSFMNTLLAKMVHQCGVILLALIMVYSTVLGKYQSF